MIQHLLDPHTKSTDLKVQTLAVHHTPHNQKQPPAGLHFHVCNLRAWTRAHWRTASPNPKLIFGNAEVTAQLDRATHGDAFHRAYILSEVLEETGGESIPMKRTW